MKEKNVDEAESFYRMCTRNSAWEREALFDLVGYYSIIGLDNKISEISQEIIEKFPSPLVEHEIESAMYVAEYVSVDDLNYDTLQDNEKSVLENPQESSANIGAAPNPFNPKTNITFKIDKISPVSVDINNIRGQKIRSLVDSKFASGQHHIHWNGKNDRGLLVSSGIYLVVVQTKNYKNIIKITMLK